MGNASLQSNLGSTIFLFFIQTFSLFYKFCFFYKFSGIARRLMPLALQPLYANGAILFGLSVGTQTCFCLRTAIFSQPVGIIGPICQRKDINRRVGWQKRLILPTDFWSFKIMLRVIRLLLQPFRGPRHFQWSQQPLPLQPRCSEGEGI